MHAGAFAIVTALAAGLVVALPVGASAAPCGGSFDSFIATFKREAAAQGVSARTLAHLDGVRPSATTLKLDRTQSAFRLTFEEFAARRITPARLRLGAQMMARHRGLLSRIEKRFGVPGEVVIAIWGLETDFGVNQGKQPVLRSAATLAHDCRRTELFQRELLASLRILDRGDLTVETMQGAWHGEIGQTQFLPSNYVKFAVDFDGNGRPDLIRSVPDVLASTANFLRGHGWRPGASYAEGGPNFQAIRQWNASSIYQRTIVLFAQRLARGP